MSKYRIKISKLEWEIEKAVLIILYVVLFVLAASTVFAYGFGYNNQVARRIGETLRLPAAFVGSDAIILSGVYERMDIAAKIPGDDLLRKVVDQTIEDRVAEKILNERNAAITDAEINAEYENIIRLTSVSNPETRYGISKESFIKNIARPAAVHNRLAILLAKDKSANSQANKELEAINEDLSNGVSFEELVVKYSDDALSAQIGGDIGYVDYTDVVPEYFSEITRYSDKDSHTVYTRDGIYVFQVVDKKQSNEGRTEFKIRHIFIKTIDHANWLKGEVDRRTVLKLI
jgi:parvulin-like peptidyl-prolyl isomerase